MKKIVLATVLVLGLGAGYLYAENKAAIELEHANKTATSIEGYAGDMSAMKASGKCNADQTGKVKAKVPKKTVTTNKALLELEHANKTATGDDSVDADMSAMKAAGKCNAGQGSKKKEMQKRMKEMKKKMKCGQGKCGGNM